MPGLSIATYNLWNANQRFHDRLDAAAQTLGQLDADVIALQEVRMVLDDDVSRDAARYIQRRTGHAHLVTQPSIDDPAEGLAIISRYPFQIGSDDTAPSAVPALRVILDVEGITVGVTNVHLDWASVTRREREITAIVDAIVSDPTVTHHDVLAGDFNSVPESSVYRFLAGQQSLHGHETTPWHDLAATWAIRTGSIARPTLDKLRNPRWRDQSTLDQEMRVDWILVRDSFATGIDPMTLTEAGIFGETPSRAGLVPSDHYGVVARLDVPAGGSRRG